MGSIDRRSELLIRLSEGITLLTSSEEWVRHLEFQSRFHRYSFSNVVLIGAQFPEASRVAGFHCWKRQGRRVRKGEKAIWILAPMVRRIADDGSGDDRVVNGFKYVAVFDISQTEGDDPPDVCHRLVGEEPSACFERLAGVARSLGFSVERAPLPGGVNGDCTFNERCIRVEGRNSPAQQVKTLAHEIAHAVLHRDQRNRHLAELEAESTAYVVCHRLGLDTSSYTFGYVATWAGGGDQAVAGIKSSCSSIQGAAATILDRLGPDCSDGPEARGDAEERTDTKGTTSQVTVVGQFEKGPQV